MQRRDLRAAAPRLLAWLLTLSCTACSRGPRQALPVDVESHFAAAAAWDVYEVRWSDDPDLSVRVAGYPVDTSWRKVTVVGEELERLRSTIWAGIEAAARKAPELASVLAPEYLVAARHGERDMALVFQFVGAPRIDYYTGDESDAGMVNSDSSPREVLLRLFPPGEPEQAR